MHNFYEHQARARALTRRLMALWTFSVICLIGSTTVLVVGGMRAVYATEDPYYSFNLADIARFGVTDLRPEQFAAVGGFILAGIGLMALFKRHQLRAGGVKIAQMLGGWQIDENSRREHERLAYNIVREMALASNMPMPAVFIMQDLTINAFAAGHTPEDAAIGLTRGAIEKLTREELQGVIAHEFSHIANGDMRLNLRIVIAIAGLTFIYLIGRTLCETIRGGGDKKGAAPLVALGIALVAIGLAGTIFGYIIQAAISRQREYLADASAVQYTRNPKGIASALQKISELGSDIDHPKATEFSHMMFGQGFRGRLLATHPPVKRRIERLRGSAKKRAAPHS